MSSSKHLAVVRPRRASPILVCKKCMKRCDDGADIKRELKSELKRDREDGMKPARIVATGCFGLCPKRAVVMASGDSLARGEYVLVSGDHSVPDALKQLRQRD